MEKNAKAQQQEMTSETTADSDITLAAVNTPEEIIAAVKENGETDEIHVPEDVADKAKDFAKRRQERQKLVSDKLTLISEINSALTEAAKLAEQGGTAEKEAFEKSQTAALKLYQGWTSGAFDGAQVTEILGRKFGAKKKGDSKTRVNWASGDDASTTPFGMGEAIRKRVVRAVRAHEFVQSNGTEGVAFFDTLEAGDVKSELDRVNSGKLSIYSLYDNLAALKTKANEGNRPQAAFDPARVTKLTDKLGENVSTSMAAIGGNESLFNAYADLRDMINLIFDEIGVSEQQAA